MRGSGLWRWRQPSAGLAITGRAIAAFKNSGKNGGKNGGAPRFERKELPEGLVKVSATTPNIQSVRDLAQIVQAVLDAVGARRERLALALPDLAITTAVFPGRGRAPERELKKELASILPYALREARCDFWRGRHDEVLAAAVREMVGAPIRANRGSGRVPPRVGRRREPLRNPELVDPSLAKRRARRLSPALRWALLLDGVPRGGAHGCEDETEDGGRCRARLPRSAPGPSASR